MVARKRKNGGCLAILIICLCIVALYLWSYPKDNSGEVDQKKKISTTKVDSTPTKSDKKSSESLPSNQSQPKEALPLEIPVASNKKNCKTIEHMGYTVSYNCKEKIPQWVAYSLTAAEAEANLPRKDKFTEDPDLHGAQASDSDYKRSGWDRGHMAPAADMKWSSQAMRESFYLTNICPQSHNVNAGDWKTLEELCRKLAFKHKKVYIACGPVIDKREFGTIGANRVTVPDGFFKVLLMKTSKGWHSIGFLFSNRPGHKKLYKYACPVDEVEKKVEMDFFSALDDSIEDKIEKECNPIVFGITFN